MINNNINHQSAASKLLHKSRVFHYAFIMLLSLQFVWSFEATAQITAELPAACATCPVTISPSTNGTGVVTTYAGVGCTGNGTITGPMIAGTPVSGVTMQIYANVTTLGSYDITAGPTNGVTFRRSGTFTTLGCQLITLTATGTPTAAGTNTFTTNTTPSVSAPGTTVGVVPAYPTGTGTLFGRICFDVAISNNNLNDCGTLISRASQQADFTLTATNTQTYTFTPAVAVTDIAFVYVNTSGTPITSVSAQSATSAAAGTPITATVNYDTNNNVDATGLTRTNALTADIYVTYKEAGVDKQLKISPKVQDCACCGAPTASGEFLVFMCHNLGADETADPFTPSWKLNGAYIQWGRRGPTTSWQTTISNSLIGFRSAPVDGTPAGAQTSSLAGPWAANSAASTAWNVNEAAPLKTALDPCPLGYRIPTITEWESILLEPLYIATGVVATATNITQIAGSTWYQDGTNADYDSGYLINNTLYLPAAGYALESTGNLNFRNNTGIYHSSTYEPFFNSRGLAISASGIGIYQPGSIQYAYTIRCIAE